MTLLTADIPFKADKPITTWLGRAVQAWLLHQVERHDPALSARLHKGTQSRRPYTVYVAADRLRITSVDAELSTLLNETILPKIDTISLAGFGLQLTVPYQIDTSDFDTLARAAFSTETIPTLAFDFISPTAFHSGLLSIPLPLPVLVLGSLIQAWNTFSPVALPVTLQDFIECCVGISRHRIKTQMVKLGAQERHVGFIGMAEYMIVPQEKSGFTEDEYRLRVQTLDLLSRFAGYVGVGIRTAVGMGQVRLIEKSTISAQSSGR